jgi:hypothetical protein
MTLLDGQGEEYATVGADASRKLTRIQVIKVLSKGNGETVTADCQIGSSHVEQ